MNRCAPSKHSGDNSLSPQDLRSTLGRRLRELSERYSPKELANNDVSFLGSCPFAHIGRENGHTVSPFISLTLLQPKQSSLAFFHKAHHSYVRKNGIRVLLHAVDLNIAARSLTCVQGGVHKRPTARAKHHNHRDRSLVERQVRVCWSASTCAYITSSASPRALNIASSYWSYLVLSFSNVS